MTQIQHPHSGLAPTHFHFLTFFRDGSSSGTQGYLQTRNFSQVSFTPSFLYKSASPAWPNAYVNKGHARNYAKWRRRLRWLSVKPRPPRPATALYQCRGRRVRRVRRRWSRLGICRPGRRHLRTRGWTRRGLTGVRLWTNGGSSNFLRKLKHMLRGGDSRSCSGLTGLISTCVFRITHTSVCRVGGMRSSARRGGWVGAFTRAGATHFIGSAEVFTGVLTGGSNTSELHWGKTLGTRGVAIIPSEIRTQVAWRQQEGL